MDGRGGGGNGCKREGGMVMRKGGDVRDDEKRFDRLCWREGKECVRCLRRSGAGRMLLRRKMIELPAFIVKQQVCLCLCVYVCITVIANDSFVSPSKH